MVYPDTVSKTEWTLMLVLRILRLLVGNLNLTDELRDNINSEIRDMQLVLRGDKTLAEFASSYPGYERKRDGGG